MERIERRTVERPIVFATRVLSNTRHKHKEYCAARVQSMKQTDEYVDQ